MLTTLLILLTLSSGSPRGGERVPCILVQAQDYHQPSLEIRIKVCILYYEVLRVSFRAFKKAWQIGAICPKIEPF